MRAALRIGAAAACILAPLLMLTGTESPVRVLAALTLFCVAPGVAALPLLAPRVAAPEPALVLAASLGVSVVASQAMLWAGVWDPRVATCALAAACLVPITAQLAREGAS
jgi:hypothetical protein